MDNDKMPAGLGCNEGLGPLPEHSMDMHMVAIPMRCRDDAKRYAERYAKAYAEHAVARERQRTMFSRRPGLWALQAREVLELIAAPQRPDGTWNRDREACRKLAAEALGRYEDSETPNVRAGTPRCDGCGKTLAGHDRLLRCVGPNEPDKPRRHGVGA